MQSLRQLILLTVLATVFPLSGCVTSAPDLGDQMRAQGGTLSELGNQWKRGQKLIEEGRVMIEDGEEAVEDGEDEIESGRSQVRKGRGLIEQGREAMKEGAALMREAETAYQDRPAAK